MIPYNGAGMPTEEQIEKMCNEKSEELQEAVEEVIEEE